MTNLINWLMAGVFAIVIVLLVDWTIDISSAEGTILFWVLYLGYGISLKLDDLKRNR